jgi:hypothetical protein
VFFLDFDLYRTYQSLVALSKKNPYNRRLIASRVVSNVAVGDHREMTVPAALTVLLANIALLCSTLGSPRLDLTDRLIAAKLLALSSSGGGETIDCGSTSAIKPRNKASLCAETAFRKKKPFHVLYSDPAESWFYSRSSYGLAGDAHGNVYGVLFSSRGLLHLGMGKNSKVFDGNRIRVTPCIKPVHLSRTEEGPG